MVDAEILDPVSHNFVWERLLESHRGGRRWCGPEKESREGCGVSHWSESLFLVFHGGLVSGAAHQSETEEADPSWHKETGSPPGPL